MNADGSDQRQLTTDPADDAQADWSPRGSQIAYRIRKPGATTNFEVARMTAAGAGIRRLTTSPPGESSSQPSWFPDGGALLFRRSGPGPVAGIWRIGTLGQSPAVAFDPPGAQWYPSWSPDATRVLFATTVSPTGDRDRAIFSVRGDGGELTALFDVAGAYDSAPAWSPDGTRIAFESNADVGGSNPEGDMEIWVMGATGAGPVQLTRNALHDEGPAWSPDGQLLAYASGPDNEHGDVNLMTAAGAHLRALTSFEGRDESPDWQAIPAPPTARRCGDVVATGPGPHDVRATRLRCGTARALAARWSRTGRVPGFRSDADDYGGTRRVVLRRRGGRGALVAFLDQPA